MAKGRITKVAGPLVVADGMRDANMYDVVAQSVTGEEVQFPWQLAENLK